MRFLTSSIVLYLVLLSITGVLAAPEAPRASLDKKVSPDLTTVLQSIAKTLQLLAARNTTVVVLPPPVTVTPNTSIVVVPSPVNVTAIVSNTCAQSLPMRGMHYFEAPRSIYENTTIVLPLPNGVCTVTTFIGHPNGFRGSIEAFDGYTTAQTKLCDPLPSTLCAHTLTISDAYPFARISATQSSIYPTIIVSYSCV